MRTSALSWSTVGTVSVDTGLTRTRSSASTRRPRSTAPEVCAYYARLLRERLLASGKVSFYPNCDYVGNGQFRSRVSGKRYEVRGAGRVVDARYLSPRIPATTPAP